MKSFLIAYLLFFLHEAQAIGQNDVQCEAMLKNRAQVLRPNTNENATADFFSNIYNISLYMQKEMALSELESNHKIFIEENVFMKTPSFSADFMKRNSKPQEHKFLMWRVHDMPDNIRYSYRETWQDGSYVICSGTL